jgi:hypothetical protein
MYRFSHSDCAYKKAVGEKKRSRWFIGPLSEIGVPLRRSLPIQLLMIRRRALFSHIFLRILHFIALSQVTSSPPSGRTGRSDNAPIQETWLD